MVLLLFYGTCQSVCPILVRDVQRIEAALAAAERDAARFVLVTFDPEVDTPERLSPTPPSTASSRSAGCCCTARPSRCASSRVLGVVPPDRRRPVRHTLRITLLDREGGVVEHYDGLERPLDPIAARVSSLLAAEAAPR